MAAQGSIGMVVARQTVVNASRTAPHLDLDMAAKLVVKPLMYGDHSGDH